MNIRGFLGPATIGIACGALGATAFAAPMTYEIDPNHTHPSFAADHMGGLSKWRGKINGATGTVTMDKEAGTGTVNITMDMSTIDFGVDALNTHAQSADMFDVAKYPTATYTGKLVGFMHGAPSAVEGTLTMHGVSKPVRLSIDSFKCMAHPMQRGKEVCGADASAKIDRSDFGVTFGQGMFNMGVDLQIQIEALAPMPE